MQALRCGARVSAVLATAALAGCHCRYPPRDSHAKQDLAASQSVALFDGLTLSGWTQRGGRARYTVEEECIVGRTVPDEPNSFLCTQREYADFVLTLEFMVDDELNSGVQIRSESRADYQDGRVHGYQVEIDPSERAWTGGIYDEGRRGWLDDLADNPHARSAFKHGEWNRLRIEAVGEHIRTWLNDVPAADLHDSMTASGFIALQVHGVGDRMEPLEVRWRNISLDALSTRPVKGLPSSAAPDRAQGPPASR